MEELGIKTELMNQIEDFHILFIKSSTPALEVTKTGKLNIFK